MKLDVILSTLNGPARLAKTLEAFCALDIPENLKLSVIAVNTQPTDSSIKVLKAFEHRLRLKILDLPDQEKNAALNHALAFSKGELVLFTDDDSIPRENWVVEMSSASERHAGFDLFAGAVTPKWSATPPPRLLRDVPLDAAFGLTPTTLKAGPCDVSEFRGTNMAVRKYVFLAGHRFDESRPHSAEDTADSDTGFLRRCQKAKHKAFFVSEAIVDQVIEHEQWTPRWLRHRAETLGRKVSLSEIHAGSAKPDAADLQSATRWAFRKKMGHQLRAAFSIVTNFGAVWQAGFYEGYMREYQNWYQTVSRKKR